MSQGKFLPRISPDPHNYWLASLISLALFIDLIMKKRTEKDFCKPEIVSERINELREIDLSLEKITPDILKPYIGKICDGLAIVASRTYAKRLYRARKNKTNKSFKNIEELWCPRPKYVKKYGRVNNTKRSYLYCSSSEATAVTELGVAIGDTVTVLRCRLKDRTVLPVTQEIGMLELTDFEFKGNKNRVAVEKLRGVADYLSPRGVKVNEIIRKFLVEEFTRVVPQGQEYNYKISISIAEMYFENDS